VPVADDDEDDDDDGGSSASWLHSSLLLPGQFLQRHRPLVAWLLLYKTGLRAGGLPNRTAFFLLKTSTDTKKNTKEHMNVKKKVFPPFCAWFPMCSHYVPFKFPMSSHQVPNVFPKVFSTAPHFYPICFCQMLSSFHTSIMWAKGKELYTSKWNLLVWWASIVSDFFEWWAN
jgi:hypothetical protein